jgi:hypothetical protein
MQGPSTHAVRSAVHEGRQWAGSRLHAQVQQSTLRAVSVTSSKSLVGDFNAHLADALFVFVDEALFAGSPAQADRFKSLITEPMVGIESKGVDTIEMENRMSFMMATNHNWAATVGWSDRRFAMFEVSDTPQTRQYWDGLHFWLTAGGKHIVLDFLQRRDLADFHPVDSRPRTPIYVDQRKQSLRDSQRWWMSVLDHEGFAAGTRSALPVIVPKDGKMPKAALYAAYCDWFKDTQHRAAHPTLHDQFFKDLRAMTGETLVDSRPQTDGERERVLFFPMAANDSTSGSGVNWEHLKAQFEGWIAS